MVLKKNLKVCQRFNTFRRQKSTKYEYEIPERYRDSFYLANAAFFDSTNWYLHRAYEAVFPKLKEDLVKQEKYKQYTEFQAHEKIKNVVDILDQCNSIIDIRFPIKREKTGLFEIVRCFRAQYGQSSGKYNCLGGIRIEENITRDQMKALSVISNLKNSCMGINFSGAFGGIKICPTEYTENEYKSILENYVFELCKKGYCGYRDVIHPDVNTSKKEMTLIAKSFEKCSGQNVNITATGKCVECGGIEEYEKAGPYAAYLSLNFFLNDEELMSKIKLTKGLKNKTFIIQGLGKMGASLAKILTQNGAICVGVKDHDAYIYDNDGLNIEDLLNHKAKTGSIKQFGKTKPETNDKIFTELCDIIVFAAYQKGLICYVARDVKAKVILEAADGPVTPSAHRTLSSRQQLVIPDIYACAGSTVASYFEYLRNLQQLGLFDQSVLRYSNNVYNNIISSTSYAGQQKMAVGSSGSNKIDIVSSSFDHATMKNALECVFLETGQEILKNLKDHKLGVELRTAAYISAINNTFKTLYSTGKYI